MMPLFPRPEIHPDEAAARGIHAPVYARSDGAPGAIVIASGDTRGPRLIPERAGGYCCGLDGADAVPLSRAEVLTEGKGTPPFGRPAGGRPGRPAPDADADISLRADPGAFSTPGAPAGRPRRRAARDPRQPDPPHARPHLLAGPPFTGGRGEGGRNQLPSLFNV